MPTGAHRANFTVFREYQSLCTRSSHQPSPGVFSQPPPAAFFPARTTSSIDRSQAAREYSWPEQGFRHEKFCMILGTVFRGPSTSHGGHRSVDMKAWPGKNGLWRRDQVIVVKSRRNESDSCPRNARRPCACCAVDRHFRIHIWKRPGGHGRGALVGGRLVCCARRLPRNAHCRHGAFSAWPPGFWCIHRLAAGNHRRRAGFRAH